MNITHILSSTASHKLLICEFQLIIGIIILFIWTGRTWDLMVYRRLGNILIYFFKAPLCNLLLILDEMCNLQPPPPLQSLMLLNYTLLAGNGDSGPGE